MSTMVERVARALHEKMCEQDVNGYLAAQLDAADLARAAMEAMRSPTFDPDSVSYHDGMTRADWWDSMIQAALKGERMTSPFEKSTGRTDVRCYTDGYPHSTRISVAGVDIYLYGIEEVSDLHYMLGRLLEHLKSEQERK